MRKFQDDSACQIGEEQQLQCGRIYKDAEMNYGGRGVKICAKCFNVAASIKMRKFSEPYGAAKKEVLASMWPHL